MPSLVASGLALVLLGAAACGSGGLDCRGILCGAAPPALVIDVADARGGLLSAQVTISNLVVPQTVHDATSSCSPPGGRVTCTIYAHEAGHYELDIGAAGYSTQHLAVDVAEAVTGKGCCEIPYVPAHRDIFLSP